MDLTQVRKTLHWIFECIGIVSKSMLQELKPFRELNEEKWIVKGPTSDLACSDLRFFNTSKPTYALSACSPTNTHSAPNARESLSNQSLPSSPPSVGMLATSRARAYVRLATSEMSITMAMFVDLHRSLVQEMGMPLKLFAGIFTGVSKGGGGSAMQVVYVIRLLPVMPCRCGPSGGRV